MTLLDDYRFVIDYQARKTDVSDILLNLQKANIKISDISTKQSDLEDVFKFLTKK